MLHVHVSLRQYYFVLPEIYMKQPAPLMRMIVLLDVPDTPYISVILGYHILDSVKNLISTSFLIFKPFMYTL